MAQLQLFQEERITPEFNLQNYDRTIIAFSGGKDSLACLLWAIENHAPSIELWHHEVDGREGSTLMDWPCTAAYCEAIAKALELPIYFSWLQGGIEREMNRNEQRKAPTNFETPQGLKSAGGTRGKLSTRLKFPQVSGDLSVRWCSSYAKIDVGSMAIANQPRFLHSRTLVLSGERAEESSQRAKYEQLEPDRTHSHRRHVDRYRPVHDWKEEQVWEIIARHKINPHPAYQLGWGRLSCMCCIFGSPNQWASIQAIAPEKFQTIANYEKQFGTTIQRKESVLQMAERGTPYPETRDADLVAIAMSKGYEQPIFAENWSLPAGAYGESHGPI